jgi:hypothetical protein
VVHFAVSAGDGFTATTPATASPPSGSLFPVGTTTVNVTATDTNNQVWSKSFDVTVFPGPSQLQQINPGAGVAAGTVSLNPTTQAVTIAGTGGTTAGGATGDLWTGTNDSNTYLSMPWQGDGVFTARLAAFSSPSDASAKAGIIFRETTLAGSRFSVVYLMNTGSGTVGFQHKTATAGATTNTNFFNGSVAGVGIPEWIRMRRQGDTFTLYYSNTGTSWTELSSRSNAMTGFTLSVGFVVAPRTGNTTATATFDTISFLALPSAPSGLTATPGANSVTLAWNAVTDAASYTVKRAASPGGPYTNLATGLTAPAFTDTTATAGTTNCYCVTASNLVGEGAASAEISAAPWTVLQGWRQQYFGTPANSGNAADTADPDGDGVNNLAEYALGTLPNSAASGANPAGEVFANRLRLTFLRARSDVTYVIEATNTLTAGPWETLATNPGAVGESVTVTDTVDLGPVTNPRRFLRLRVTTP